MNRPHSFHDLKHTALRIVRDKAGTTTTQMAIYFAVGALGIALIAPQFLSSGVARFAASPSGIDRVTTGSITQKKRFTVRKSILDLEQAN